MYRTIIRDVNFPVSYVLHYIQDFVVSRSPRQSQQLEVGSPDALLCRPPEKVLPGVPLIHTLSNLLYSYRRASWFFLSFCVSEWRYACVFVFACICVFVYCMRVFSVCSHFHSWRRSRLFVILHKVSKLYPAPVEDLISRRSRPTATGTLTGSSQPRCRRGSPPPRLIIEFFLSFVSRCCCLMHKETSASRGSQLIHSRSITVRNRKPSKLKCFITSVVWCLERTRESVNRPCLGSVLLE